MAPDPQPGDARALVPPPAPAAEGWLRLGSGFGLPMVWMVVSLLAIPLAVYVALYLPWAFIDNHQLVAGWPAGNTGQTLRRAHRGDVPLPQQPDGGPRRELAVVGLAAQPQARLVLPGLVRERDGGLDLRRRQHGHLVDGHPRDGLRRLPGVQAPQPRAGPDPHRLPVPVGLVGTHRPGLVPVPLLHEPAVRDPGARLLRGRAVARRLARHVAVRPRGGRHRAAGPGDPVAPAPPAVRDRGRRVGQRGLAGLQRQPRQPGRDARGVRDGGRGRA